MHIRLLVLSMVFLALDIVTPTTTTTTTTTTKPPTTTKLTTTIPTTTTKLTTKIPPPTTKLTTTIPPTTTKLTTIPPTTTKPPTTTILTTTIQSTTTKPQTTTKPPTTTIPPTTTKPPPTTIPPTTTIPTTTTKLTTTISPKSTSQTKIITSISTAPTTATTRRQVNIQSIVSTTTKTAVQVPHYHPLYRYSCNEDLSVTFKGVNGAIEYFPAANKTDSCTIENISGHNGNFKIAKECLSSMNFKEIRWIQVAVYDKNEGEILPTTTPTTTTNNDTITSSDTNTSSDTTTNTPTTSTSPKLITGHHIFNLTCLPLEEEGVDRMALSETGITDIEQLHNVYNEIGQVEMRFKEDESLDKPDLSEVYIGDRFFMYLKYMGDTEGYFIVPQTCTAYKGNFRTNTGEQLELWKQRVSSGGDCITPGAKQYNVMKNFKRLNKTVVHAELHGFCFSSELTGDFDDVTISCTVKICTGIGGKCQDNCNIVGYRRRRGIDQADGNTYKTKRSTGRIRSQTVFQTIKVGLREFKSNNGGKNGVHGGNVAILVLTGIVFWKSFC